MLIGFTFVYFIAEDESKFVYKATAHQSNSKQAGMKSGLKI